MSNFGGYSKVGYISDNGGAYFIRQRTVDANGVGNNVGFIGGGVPPLPRSITPRHVWFDGSDGGRRKVAIGGSSSAFLTTNDQSFTADGVTYTNSGRVGEKSRGSVAG